MASAEPRGERLVAGALTFWVERAGHGVPLLLITGLGYATWCWGRLRADLADVAATVAFDNRGTGRSDKPTGPYSIEQMADDAAAVLDAVGVRDAHVLGHSMGGYIAIALALRHAARVRSLVLVGTSPGGPDTKPVPEETMAVWQLAGSLPPAEYARRSMPQSFAPGWAQAHPEAFESLLAQRLQHPTPSAAWLAQYQACVDYVTRGASVERIAAPALVVHGVQDRVVPLHNGALLAERLPQARLATLPAAGHLPYLEDPAGFARLVRTHLQEHS